MISKSNGKKPKKQVNYLPIFLVLKEEIEKKKRKLGSI